MKLSYNPHCNIAYIELLAETGPETGPIEKRRIDKEIHLHVGPGGRIYGIALLNAREQLTLDTITLTNEASKSSRKIVLGW